MDEIMSWETMALKVVNKINGKLKSLYRKNSFSTPGLWRMLCNTLIQPHFDYAFYVRYPNLNVKLWKMEIIQNKWIRFCLKLKKMLQIFEEGPKTINWLPVDQRVQQSVNVTVFKYVNNAWPYKLKEVQQIIVLDLSFIFVKLTCGKKVCHIFVPHSGKNC